MRDETFWQTVRRRAAADYDPDEDITAEELLRLLDEGEPVELSDGPPTERGPFG